MNTVKINIIVFGLDNLGSSLIKSIISQQNSWLQSNALEIAIPIIADYKIVFFENNAKKNNWDADFSTFGSPVDFPKLADFLLKKTSENTIIIDTTNSSEILAYYPDFLHNEIEIISTNTIAQNLPAEIAFLFKITQKSFFPAQNIQQIENRIQEIAKKFILPIAS